jgi:hypothetical protein
LTKSIDKWAQSTKGERDERGGINITNVGRLGMWSNHKMKFAAFIHNDDNNS